MTNQEIGRHIQNVNDIHNLKLGCCSKRHLYARNNI